MGRESAARLACDTTVVRRLATAISHEAGATFCSGVGPVAASEHPSAVAKHDKPARIPFDASLVDRTGNLDVGVSIDDLLDAFPSLLKSSIEYRAMSQAANPR